MTILYKNIYNPTRQKSDIFLNFLVSFWVPNFGPHKRDDGVKGPKKVVRKVVKKRSQKGKKNGLKKGIVDICRYIYQNRHGFGRYIYNFL